MPLQNKLQLKLQFESALDFAGTQLRGLITRHPNYFPMYTKNGKWKHSGEAWTNWCEGFLGGQLWLMYRYTMDDWWREKAEHYSKLIEHRKTDRNVHDLGFLFWSTWKRWFDITGDAYQKQVVIDAGRTMGHRFQEKGSYLRSFVAPESLFIDIMMNVGIIFYAAKQSDDSQLWDKALRHCLTTRRYLVRGDGSTSHEGIFDVELGTFLRQSTHQGWRDDSSWARGLTWAIYGFGTVYHFTEDTRFLHTAELCADYYMRNTDRSGVPPNDWMEPGPTFTYESSAAAIAACGFLQLARITPDSINADQYLEYALTILQTLSQPMFLAINDAGWEGILKHGMYHERKGLGVDESVMWGDHFFVEALLSAIELLNRKTKTESGISHPGAPVP